MIKAIIFDCFGVLTTDGWRPFKDKHFGTDPDRFQQASDLNKQAGSGMMNSGDFLREIAGLARISPQKAADEINNSSTNLELLEYIKSQLKPRYRIGMLSNAGSNILHTLFTPEQVSLFDEIALSYEMGAVKPEHSAYATILDRMGVEPGESAFIDDQERHCAGARSAGMRAIMYKDFRQLRSELEPMLTQA